MKKLFFGFFLLPGLLLADITIIQKFEMKKGESTFIASSMSIQVKGQKARIDTIPTSQSTLIDLQAGTFYRIDHSLKQATAMAMHPVLQRAIGDDAGNRSPSDEQALFKKTGKTKNISGYTCQEYTCATPPGRLFQLSFWMAENMDARAMEPFQAFLMVSSKMMGLKDIQIPKGLLMAGETTLQMMGETMLALMEVQSVKHEDLDESLFVLPQDYQIKELAQ